MFIKNRIRLMKQFASSPREFRGLKRYWKSLLVPSEQLDFEHFHKWTNFPYWIAATDVVHNLLSLDSELKQIYEVLNHVRTAIQHKGWNNYNTACWKAEGFSEEMNSTIEML
ncbi:transposase IS204 IS1001 IS1096 IS1165 family protein [Liquorilactobacillus aquaticus DSM 21051]|uniref:Transposase IS204 IS1001 IS1096 IS1165 family protein n=1 Tax=Liquorilactobacillus aquaticus DSM 21051 TaxID=1423725 RepID=A0A0R2D070_9LACO|nr:transposase IS204 IS1001 IS1096 IS1165 family protein [Liquorilactobacillus aquaticus DSM 21051]